MTEERVPEGEVICLGDQSPWAGGLLRLAAMREYTDNLIYFFHDGDAPWVSGNSPEPRIIQGWPKESYFSLATRHPWSLAIPNLTLEAPRTSLGTPMGLSRLVGGPTQQMIFGMRDSSPLVDLVSDLLHQEISWAERLGDWLGIDGRCELPESGSVLEIAESLNTTDIPVKSFVELFLNEKPLTKKDLPSSYFWEIDFNEGTRKACSSSNGRPVIPKGIALPLEIAARGWALGCTHLGYLQKVLQLRDRYYPGLPVIIYHINFDWEIDPDPIDFLLDIFKERKRKRNQNVPDFNGEGEMIKGYWRNRPTSASFSVLGGRLRPSFVRKVY